MSLLLYGVLQATVILLLLLTIQYPDFSVIVDITSFQRNHLSFDNSCCALYTGGAAGIITCTFEKLKVMLKIMEGESCRYSSIKSIILQILR